MFDLPGSESDIGLRDKTLMCFMDISGTRAQEVCELTVGDMQFYPDLKSDEYFKYLPEEISKHGEFEDPVFLDELLSWSETLPKVCYKTKK